MANEFKPGDWALHVSGGLDAREVYSSGGDLIRLRIGTAITGPLPAANYRRIPKKEGLMARISDRLLVQRVDDQMVLLDEVSGAEFTFPITNTEQVVRAMTYLATGDQSAAAAIAFPSVVD